MIKCSDLEKILKESVKEEGIQAELAKFSDGKEFLHFIKSGSTLDLLFLEKVFSSGTGKRYYVFSE